MKSYFKGNPTYRWAVKDSFTPLWKIGIDKHKDREGDSIQQHC